jgi:hypothetical protein
MKLFHHLSVARKFAATDPAGTGAAMTTSPIGQVENLLWSVLDRLANAAYGSAATPAPSANQPLCVLTQRCALNVDAQPLWRVESCDQRRPTGGATAEMAVARLTRP